MDYYKYIADYLKLPLQDIKSKSSIIYLNDFPDFLRIQYNYLNDKSLNDLVLFVVPDEYFMFKGNNRTSEAHFKQKIVFCNQTYISRGKDPNASFIHNLAHIQQYHLVGERLFNKYGNEKVFKDMDCIYPNNKIELYAFNIELRYLLHKGVSLDFFIKYMRQYSDKACREEFFNRLIEHINKDG